MLADAIRRYHDLLTPALAAESHERLAEQQRRRGLGFGDKPLCNVLRPRLLTLDQYRFIRRAVAPLMEAGLIIHERAVKDDAFRRQFRLTPEEDDLFRIDPGYPCPMPTARLDAFFIPESNTLKFTEFNAETPAAAAYTDELADAFLNLPVMAAFQRHYNAVLQPARPGSLNSLLECWKEWGGKALPRVAILDWKEVPTYHEFVLWVDYMARQGIEARIIDPREVEFSEGRLRQGDYAIDLIYKRVLISELVERGGLNHPVFAALRSRAVCMVNPLRCKALYKKASLAVLSDDSNAGLFTRTQFDAIAAHIPWTRVMEERKTGRDGAEVDLVKFTLANRERLVLKPNDDYGGKGIVLGWTVEQGKWEEAVNVALSTPYIVQERVDLPSEPWPAWADGSLHIGERMLDTAPYVSMGRHLEGCLTRIATDPLLNVTAGGGSTVPTFVIEER
jgi:glutathionylspermidine synthase